jgi:hypothetical protein
MRHPLEFVPNKPRQQIFFTFIALTVILFAVFRVLNQPLRTDAAPNGVVSLELAGNPQIARTITDSWKQASLLLGAVAGQPNPDIVNLPYVFAAFGLGIDYLFMPVYALTLAFGMLLAARRHEGFIKSLGSVAGYAAFATALFDAVENYALFRVLLGIFDPGDPALATFVPLLSLD